MATSSTTGRRLLKHDERLDTRFGCLEIENVPFDPFAIEDSIYPYVLEKENLGFVFCNESPTAKQLHLMLRRFGAEDTDVRTTLGDFVDGQMRANSGFYSFFAEALLPLAYRDIYGYKLQTAAVDINQTLTGHSTGADSCLYDPDGSLFVLGEAKFYKDFDAAFRAIIVAFTNEKGFLNKMNHFYLTTRNTEAPSQIALRILGKDSCQILEKSEFLKLKIRFAGFILHEETSPVPESYCLDEKYNDGDEYRKLLSRIQDNINNCVYPVEMCDLGVTIFHIFIHSKRELIIKCIEKALAEAKKARVAP